MRRGHETQRFLLILVLVICIPLAFTFFHYYSLSIADFLSRELKFEARDQISLSTVGDNKFKVFGLTGLNHLFFLDHKIFKQLHTPSLELAFPEFVTFILRC